MCCIVFLPSSIQRDLYEESFRNLVESVLGGYNGETVVDICGQLCSHIDFESYKLLFNCVLM